MGEHEVGRRAVFLDRDGVLNKSIIRDGRPYPPSAIEEFELYQDVPAGCVQLAAAGYVLVVVTNQPDVGRKTQTRDKVEAMHRKMLEALPQIARVETCWHGGSDWGEPCECRKPKPGMILHAAKELEIDLTRSFMIGDRWRDVNCGRQAGCRTVFIDHGYSEDLRDKPDWTVKSFGEAVAVVLKEG